jgi:hypothetical protein
MITTQLSTEDLQSALESLLQSGVITGFSTRDSSYELSIGETVTTQQLDDALTTHQAEQAAAASRATSRAALRQQWDALPAIYRGPYRPEFEAANRLLDEGDDEGAAAIIAYAAPKPGFTEAEVATFKAIKSQMAAGIVALSNT